MKAPSPASGLYPLPNSLGVKVFVFRIQGLGFKVLELTQGLEFKVGGWTTSTRSTVEAHSLASGLCPTLDTTLSNLSTKFQTLTPYP
jgi:hypothetical protein